MILVDTSVWVDHLRSANPRLVEQLDAGMVLGHPWVIGELALGNLKHRSEVLQLLRGLASAVVAGDAELLEFIERARLHGSGVGYVDVQLLASTRLTQGAELWTRERRLAAIADRLGVAFHAASAH